MDPNYNVLKFYFENRSVKCSDEEAGVMFCIGREQRFSLNLGGKKDEAFALSMKVLRFFTL